MADNAKPRKVFRACDRCKRQKLKVRNQYPFFTLSLMKTYWKCDVERPCTLCKRSRISCTSTGNVYPSPSLTRKPRETRARLRGAGDISKEGTRTTIKSSLDLQRSLQDPENCALQSSGESSDVEASAATHASSVGPLFNRNHVSEEVC
jgi:hypothetical protein